MTEKWGKKDVLEYARELKSPFEEQQSREKPAGLAQLGAKLREALLKTRRPI